MGKIAVNVVLVVLLIVGLFISIPTTIAGSNLIVSYINVGQGLSVLVQMPNGRTLLYDAGPQKSANTVLNYIKSKGIKRIDAIILSHPNSDHIGAADEVIRTFSIGAVYMPKVVHSTKSYLDVLNAVKAKKLTIKTAQRGVTVALDPKVRVVMWGPVKTYSTDDTNNWSAVTSISYGSTSFLFTGDAEFKAESDMLAAGVVKPQTVLQIGHHGSKYSTSTRFLNTVKPKYAVISVGTNSYGHPAQDIISRLQNAKIQIFRTDKQGTIVAYSNGKTVTWNVKPIGNTISKPPVVTQTIRIVSKDLVGERVVIKNTGTVDVNMTGWKLVSVQGNQVFTFPTGFVLKKGASVTITSGEGAYEDWPNVLKWTTAYIWNNDGDSAKLINKDGAVVSTIP